MRNQKQRQEQGRQQQQQRYRNQHQEKKKDDYGDDDDKKQHNYEYYHHQHDHHHDHHDDDDDKKMRKKNNPKDDECDCCHRTMLLALRRWKFSHILTFLLFQHFLIIILYSYHVTTMLDTSFSSASASASFLPFFSSCSHTNMTTTAAATTTKTRTSGDIESFFMMGSKKESNRRKQQQQMQQNKQTALEKQISQWVQDQKPSLDMLVSNHNFWNGKKRNNKKKKTKNINKNKNKNDKNKNRKENSNENKQQQQEQQKEKSSKRTKKVQKVVSPDYRKSDDTDNNNDDFSTGKEKNPSNGYETESLGQGEEDELENESDEEKTIIKRPEGLPRLYMLNMTLWSSDSTVLDAITLTEKYPYHHGGFVPIIPYISKRLCRINVPEPSSSTSTTTNNVDSSTYLHARGGNDNGINNNVINDDSHLPDCPGYHESNQYCPSAFWNDIGQCIVPKDVIDPYYFWEGLDDLHIFYNTNVATSSTSTTSHQFTNEEFSKQEKQQNMKKERNISFHLSNIIREWQAILGQQQEGEEQQQQDDRVVNPFNIAKVNAVPFTKRHYFFVTSWDMIAEAHQGFPLDEHSEIRECHMTLDDDNDDDGHSNSANSNYIYTMNQIYEHNHNNNIKNSIRLCPSSCISKQGRYNFENNNNNNNMATTMEAVIGDGDDNGNHENDDDDGAYNLFWDSRDGICKPRMMDDEQYRYFNEQQPWIGQCNCLSTCFTPDINHPNSTWPWPNESIRDMYYNADDADDYSTPTSSFHTVANNSNGIFDAKNASSSSLLQQKLQREQQQQDRRGGTNKENAIHYKRQRECLKEKWIMTPRMYFNESTACSYVFVQNHNEKQQQQEQQQQEQKREQVDDNYGHQGQRSFHDQMSTNDDDNSTTTIKPFYNLSCMVHSSGEHHLYFIPQGKLIFCGIPKVGISEWIKFFRKVFGAKDYLSTPHWKTDTTDFRVSHLPIRTAEKLFNDPTWTKAVFFRDPAERLLSAYLDKVVRNGYTQTYFHISNEKNSKENRGKKRQQRQQQKQQKQKKQQQQQRTKQSTKKYILSFEEFVHLVTTNLTTYDDYYESRGLHYRTDPHWRPQVYTCAMDHMLPLYDFIGSFDHLADHTKLLLQNVGLWDEYGKRFTVVRKEDDGDEDKEGNVNIHDGNKNGTLVPSRNNTMPKNYKNNGWQQKSGALTNNATFVNGTTFTVKQPFIDPSKFCMIPPPLPIPPSGIDKKTGKKYIHVGFNQRLPEKTNKFSTTTTRAAMTTSTTTAKNNNNNNKNNNGIEDEKVSVSLSHFERHGTGSKNKLDMYYTPELYQAVRNAYAYDYEIWDDLQEKLSTSSFYSSSTSSINSVVPSSLPVIKGKDLKIVQRTCNIQ